MDLDQTAPPEPRPDMNIKVAAFTVSKKYINMVCFDVMDINASVGTWAIAEWALMGRNLHP